MRMVPSSGSCLVSVCVPQEKIGPGALQPPTVPGLASGSQLEEEAVEATSLQMLSVKVFCRVLETLLVGLK